MGKWKRRGPKVIIPVSVTIVPDVPQKWVRISNNFGAILLTVDDSIFARRNVP